MVARGRPAALALLAGCEGNLRVLYLRSEADKAAPWLVGSAIIYVRGDEAIPALVAGVAASSGLQKSSAPGCYAMAYADERRFSMCAEHDGSGAWAVSLKDWPSFRRSTVSLQVEDALRKQLAAAR